MKRLFGLGLVWLWLSLSAFAAGESVRNSYFDFLCAERTQEMVSKSLNGESHTLRVISQGHYQNSNTEFLMVTRTFSSETPSGQERHFLYHKDGENFKATLEENKMSIVITGHTDDDIHYKVTATHQGTLLHTAIYVLKGDHIENRVVAYDYKGTIVASGFGIIK